MFSVTRLIGKAVLALVAILMVSIGTISYAEDFLIDNYAFEWTVAREGKAELLVVKTNESTFIQLLGRGDYARLRLTADEAVDISRALEKTDEYFTKQKGTTADARSEVVVAGEYKVVFSTSPQYGFAISIGKDGGVSSFDVIVLDRSQAMEFQPNLAKAHELLQFVDSKINL